MTHLEEFRFVFEEFKGRHPNRYEVAEFMKLGKTSQENTIDRFAILAAQAYEAKTDELIALVKSRNNND